MYVTIKQDRIQREHTPMTDTTAHLPATGRADATTLPTEPLARENAQLRQKLADQERRLTALHATMEQLVDERIAELATLQDLDLQIHAQLDLEHVTGAVLDWAMLVTSAVAGTLYLIVKPQPHTRGDKLLRAAAQRGYPPEVDRHSHLPWPVDEGILSRALETGQAVQQTHTLEDIALSRPQDRDRSHLTVPVRHQGQAIGVLGLESAFADGFTDAQIDSALRLAEHAALAIRNALYYQRASDRLEILRSLYTNSTSLASCLASDVLARRIVGDALAVLPADRAALYRLAHPCSRPKPRRRPALGSRRF
jgi:GAF domain-containing protein